MASKTNLLDHEKDSYKGKPTTLCKGCGHNSITNHIVQAYYESSINPYKVAKMSGIGCSSKTPTYFLSLSHGFNGVHGRMPSLSTGANVANRSLSMIGVSGDGDTASIGMGQFCHLIRRNVDMVYIVENNGVYGLTKGQFSATADLGAKLKSGQVNEFTMIDCAALAIQLGGTYVGRSYSGDKKQCIPLLQGAIAHRGTAMLDIISPCITFNNHPGATKSIDWAKEYLDPVHHVDYILPEEDKTAEYAEGETFQVELPDGSHLLMKKLDRDYDPTDRSAALAAIEKATQEGITLTGLLFIDKDSVPFEQVEQLCEQPLYALGEAELRPSREALETIMNELTIVQ